MKSKIDEIRIKLLERVKEDTDDIHVGDITSYDGTTYYHGDTYGYIHRVGNTIYGLMWDSIHCKEACVQSWNYKPKYGQTAERIQRDDINGDLV